MDEFAAPSDCLALRQAIIERIAREGPITFRDFMEMALYHPRHGYYAHRLPFGPQGDYVTSPEVGPLFGALVGRQLAEMWEAMGRPRPFQVVEMGPGRGTLARDILLWAQRARHDLFDALDYCLLERSEALQAAQELALACAGLQVRHLSCLAPDSIEGCIISNELVDSFPVHRVLVRDGRLWEIYVGCQGQGLGEEQGPPSTPALEGYFRRLGLWPGEGCYAEVNLEALDWVRSVGRALRRGFVITFDYGYEAEELYAPWRHQGTLLCFHRHRPSSDPYVRLGWQDMTSHVDFTSLVQAGRETGLQPLGMASQADFLVRLGIREALQVEGLDLEEAMARRRMAAELLDPAGLGRIRVLVQGKGIGPCRLRGLEGQP
ncbi:MAG TPA: SAM-dependent methyltransferase [Dehalococcoidia bacterium]|nr:SAM-dependent methyltransferase [Dehalococcoidia bacterium]